MNRDGVHIAHCCKRHGCKYGDDDCAVMTGAAKQAHSCEDCDAGTVAAALTTASDRDRLVQAVLDAARVQAEAWDESDASESIYIACDQKYTDACLAANAAIRALDGAK